MNDADPRLAAIDRELSRSLASARAAEDRVWAALRVKHEPSAARIPLFGTILALAAAAAAFFVAVGWAQGVRVEVASGGVPVLYRVEAGRVELDAAGARGTLAVGERHLRDPSRLSVVADATVRLQQTTLPAEVEIRFLEEGQTAHGVLARTSQITDARADGVVITHQAPFPPLARGERRTYRVWLHVTAASGEHASPRIVIEVTGATQGQRARFIGTE